MRKAVVGLAMSLCAMALLTPIHAEESDSSFGSAANKAWQGVKSGSKEAWHGVSEGSKEAWEATKEGSSDVWQATKEGAGKVGESIGDAVSGD